MGVAGHRIPGGPHWRPWGCLSAFSAQSSCRQAERPTKTPWICEGAALTALNCPLELPPPSTRLAPSLARPRSLLSFWPPSPYHHYEHRRRRQPPSTSHDLPRQCQRQRQCSEHLDTSYLRAASTTAPNSDPATRLNAYAPLRLAVSVLSFSYPLNQIAYIALLHSPWAACLSASDKQGRPGALDS